MRSDFFSLNKLQLSAEKQSIAMRFEQHPFLVAQPPPGSVDVFLMVL